MDRWVGCLPVGLGAGAVATWFVLALTVHCWVPTGPDLPLASASPDMIRWSRVLLSHTLDAARSY